MSWDDDDASPKPSKLHFWGGALFGGESVLLSWIISGKRAAMAALKGALFGAFFGLNDLFQDDDPDDNDTADA